MFHRRVAPSFLSLLCLLGTSLICSQTIGQEPKAADPQVAAEIRQLIRDLDNDSFAVRERATHRLRQLDESVVPHLEEAARNTSPEVRMRALSLLKLMRVDPLKAFCSQPDSHLDVEQGMILIAQILDPKVKKDALTRQLDDIAAKVRARLGKDKRPADLDPQVVVAALQQVMFEDLKFKGDTETYRHIDNCSLERVLTLRKGLPITLSRVVILVARRLDVPIVGVPVTGQYIVKYDGSRAPDGFSKQDVYFHPFEGGKILSREERLKLYPHHDPDVMVPPDTSRAALVRMLNNVETALESDPTQADKLTQAQRMLELLQQRNPALR